MSVFFIGWELWEEMTFVLACCIIIVFVLGVVRLWRTNRALRHLEIIDEEKRNRLSMLSHCGIDARRPPEIPFGVRAIQNGVEVDGIWISRPNTPDRSQLAASPTLFGTTTLVGDQTASSKGKERMIDIDSVQVIHSDFITEDPTMDLRDARPVTDPSLSTSAAEADSGSCSSRNDGAPSSLAAPQALPSLSLDTPDSQRNRDEWQSSDASDPTYAHDPFRTSSDTPTLNSTNITSYQSSETEPSLTESALYRTAEVIIKRNTRGVNRRCAVVPAACRKQGLHQNSEIKEEDGSEDRGQVIKLKRKPSFTSLRGRSLDTGGQGSESSS